MPWIRLDDQFPDHPKVMAAGPLASWLYVCGIGYCNRLLTDGFIPIGQLRKLADLDNVGELAAKLLAVGLWDDAEGGYQVHDYLEYQPSREKALELREKRAEAGSRGGKQKASNLLGASQGVASDLLVAKAKQNSTPYPSRTHPVPVPNPDPAQPLESESAPPPRPLSPAPRPAVAVHPLPSIESLIEQLAEWASKKGVTDILADEVERFHAHCLTKIDPATGYLPNSKKFLYINYVAGCQKWITNPAYDHTPRNRPMTIGGNVVNLVGKDRERFEVAQRVLAKRGYGPA